MADPGRFSRPNRGKRRIDTSSDDDEPAEPPPPRSAFPQWLKAREDAGDAPPLDPDQRRACDCIEIGRAPGRDR